MKTPNYNRGSFRPMLAIGKPGDWSEDQFYEYIDKNVPRPWGITPKIDGIRCITRDCGTYVDAFSRSLKTIPNRYVRDLVARLGADFDGELTCGENFQSVTSGIMSIEGEPQFKYHIFDHIPRDPKMTYRQRVDIMFNNLRSINPSHINPITFVTVLSPIEVVTIDQVIQFKKGWMSLGAEGAILRPMDSPYKWGRSTLNEGWMIKLKDFTDAEATVIGYNEEFHNANEATQSELDYKVRSTHSANMVGKGRLGSLRVRTPEGVEFNIGTGFTFDNRYGMWKIRELLIGKIAKYKYQQHGTKDAPRTPVFLGFRSPIDMGPGK